MMHIPQAVAWTLIHFCWQAAAIAAIYRIITAAIARRSRPDPLSCRALRSPAHVRLRSRHIRV